MARAAAAEERERQARASPNRIISVKDAMRANNVRADIIDENQSA